MTDAINLDGLPPDIEPELRSQLQSEAIWAALALPADEHLAIAFQSSVIRVLAHIARKHPEAVETVDKARAMLRHPAIRPFIGHMLDQMDWEAERRALALYFMSYPKLNHCGYVEHCGFDPIEVDQEPLWVEEIFGCASALKQELPPSAREWHEDEWWEGSPVLK